MSERTHSELIEEIAALVLLAEPSDRTTLSTARSLVAELAQQPVVMAGDSLNTVVQSMLAGLDGLLAGVAGDGEAELGAVAALVTELQRALRAAATPPRMPAPAAAAPPPSPVVATPAPPAAAAPAPAVASTAPAAPAPVAAVAAPALAVASAAPAAPAPVEDAAAPRHVDRDEETVGLLQEFLQESTEGLASADQILLNSGSDEITAEMVNSLFRVFHTIKGVAGFLDLKDVTSLAHTTETLMNQVRQGTAELKGVVLDLVFDATAVMRGSLEDLPAAIREERELRTPPGLKDLLGRLEAAIRGDRTPEPEIPVVLPDKNIGDILLDNGVITEDALKQAVAAQAKTARRLGEELVAEGAVAPKEVARALQAQAQARGEQGAPRVAETVRVDLERVDSLVAMIGELVIVEAMVVHAPEIAQLSSPRVRNYMGQLSKICRDLQDVGMRMRMVPVRAAFQKTARMARDLSRKGGKQVRMILSGEATEMDRSMVEQIGDPLVHMIRNAVDHGVESAEERVRCGKPPEGTLRLSAYHQGGCIVIEISDDGKGLDRDAILRKAVSRGLVGPGDKPSDGDIFNLIFLPGFSTAAQVTETSGRGVGMDVVRRNIEAMRGRVQITSTRGEGTTFRMILPLTLAIIDGMLVSCGTERYIIPTLSVVESLKPEHSMIFTRAGTDELLDVRGEILPLWRLDRLFGVEGARSDATEALVVIVESLGRKVGLLVDDVLTQQQVVIKSLGSKLSDARHLSGAAILPDGRVGLILNVAEICARSVREGGGRSRSDAASARPPAGSGAATPMVREAA